MNNAPFYIGQKVVAVRNHSEGLFKKGDEFVVQSVEIKHCGWSVFVGTMTEIDWNIYSAIEWQCGYCKYKWIDKDPRVFFNPQCFAPIEENTYENISKELAVLPQDEVPDVKEIKVLN